MTKSPSRKKISIHVALSTVGVGLILFSSLSIGLVSYFNTKRVVNSLSDEVFNRAFREITLTAAAKLNSVDAVLEANRELMIQGFVEPDDLDLLADHFYLVLQANEHLSESGFGDQLGRAVWAERDLSGTISVIIIEPLPGSKANERVYEVDGDGRQLISESATSTYDPRARPWYRRAAASNEPVWTDPYLFNNGIPGLSRSKRLADQDGDLIGVFDASFELDFLSHFLNENKGEHLGELFLVNLKRGGEVIAHPDPSVTVDREKRNESVRTVSDINDPRVSIAYPILEEFYTGAGAQERLRRTLSIEDTPYVLVAAPFDVSPELGWYAIYLIPEAKIMGPVHRNNRATLVVCLIATSLAILVAFLISKRMSYRLNELSGEIEDVGQLILSNRNPKNSLIREIDVLESSVGIMKTGLLSFQKFVPTELVRSLLEDGAEARLEGRRQELTVFFSDIIGYSGICEQLEPEQLVEELGVYLEEMTTILENNQGTVNQYVGDAIMAIFGAPEPVEKHALQACRGALAFSEKNEEIAGKAEADGRPAFRSRIGINTGDMIVGNLGSKNRLYYTANGDEVNLAARLESINGIYGTSIVIGESTRALIGDAMVCRLLDYVAVKGKTAGTSIHELVGERGKVETPEITFIETYEAGMAHYLEREWDDAIQCFNACLAQKPDTASTVLKGRCEEYRERPPNADWTGVFEMKRK